MSPAQFRFRPNQLSVAQMMQEADRFGVLASPEWRDQFALESRDRFRPLTPLRNGHLVNLIAAGYLNNHLLDDGETQLFIKGQTYKATHVSRHIEEKPNGAGQIEVTASTDVFETKITTLSAEGEIEAIAGAELEPFLSRWIQPLTQLVLDNFEPVYQFELNGFGPRLNQLNQKRQIPNTTLRGLAPAQQHAAAAAAQRLHKRHGDAKDAIVVGEMGVGKTLIGPAVAHCIGAKRTLVLCPPHLTGKWEREIRHVVPEVRVMHLRKVSDVDAFFAQNRAVPVFGILKETTARSASGWHHAYDWCGPIRHKPAVKGKKQTVEIGSRLVEAVYGQPLVADDESGQTIKPVEFALAAQLAKIDRKLDQLLRQTQPAGPNYRRPLNAYWHFDWMTLNAEVVRRDRQGPTQVVWSGYVWTRRTGSGKYGKAIWFSRSDGRDSEGNPRYVRLITFKDAAPAEAMDGQIAPPIA